MTLNIEGKISIEGNPEVMPVRMRVAKFDGDNRVTNYERNDMKNSLDPTKPVWVVIHGRDDRDTSGKMLEMQKALVDSGYQIVTIDWREAAGLNNPESVGMQSEDWIQAVADWSFKALKMVGVTGDKVWIDGHSFGSHVGFEIAEHFKAENGFGVDTFVALDPALDPTPGRSYDASQIDFSAVSKNSIAFLSSAWGSASLTRTARQAIEIRSAPVSAGMIENQTLKHGMAITAFANLVRLKKIDPHNAIASKFSFTSEQTPAIPQQSGIDAWMYVDPYEEFGTGPTDKFIDAVPDRMTFTNPDDSEEDLFFYNPLRNLQ